MKARVLAIVLATLLIVPLVLSAFASPESAPTPAPTQAPTQVSPTAEPAQTPPAATEAPASAVEPGALFSTETVPCPSSITQGLAALAASGAEVEGQTYSCGVVVVPENYAEPDGRTIELFYLKLHSSSQSPRPEPLVYLAGGPGSSGSSEVSTNPITYLNLNQIRERQDIIAYDQRGAGYSNYLLCAPFESALGILQDRDQNPEIGAAIKDLKASEQEFGYEALRANLCGVVTRELAGVDLGQYNSVNSAQDIVHLTEALGYTEKVDLFGTSYGTRLAQYAMRSTPDRIRSVVLDGVNPANIPNAMWSIAKRFESYVALFQQCAADAACNAAYPDLAARFGTLLDTLEKTPLVFDPPLVVNPQLTFKMPPVLNQIDAAFFVQLAGLNNEVMNGGAAPLIPRYILAAEQGDVDFFRNSFLAASAPATEDVQTVVPTGGDATARLLANQPLFEAPFQMLLVLAQGVAAQAETGIESQWLSVVLGDLSQRLQAGEDQDKLMEALLHLTVTPNTGTTAQQLIDYANAYLSPSAATAANAVVGHMTRNDVRSTLWTIQDLAMMLGSTPDHRNLSNGMGNAVNCADEIAFTSLDVAEKYVADSPYPQLLTIPVAVGEQFIDSCLSYPTTLDQSVTDPVVSDIPTLIYLQQLDIQTPVTWGRAVAERLSNSRVVEWNNMGHIAITHDQKHCAGDMAAAFLDDPTRWPDMTCAQSDAYKLKFVLPATPTPSPSPIAAPTEAATAAAAAAPTAALQPAPTQAVPAAAANSETLPMPRYVKPAYTTLGTRNADGTPGPNYWQNHSVHDIAIEVSPPERTVTGTQTITYTNNSPNPLPMVVVRLFQNSRLPEANREDPVTRDFLTDGIQIDEFSVDGQVMPWATFDNLLPFKTVKLVPLAKPLLPGESTTFTFKWHYDLGLQYNREGVFDPTTYFIGYFFPRIATFSDTDAGILPGWDLEEYTYRSGRELHNDFADFTYSVTVPKDFLVWGTGELQNPDEVLQPDAAQRLLESRTSDEIINIATPEDLMEGLITAQTDTVTWRWKAENVTDVALGLSDHYAWDAGSVVADPATDRRVSVHAAYSPEFADFDRMAQDIKDIVAFASSEWPGVPWPYSHANVFVGGGDEEFPMLANDGADAGEGRTVRFIAAHELLHNYFPFYMGIDERRYPFMDEGWTTAFEYLFNLEDIGQAAADTLFIDMRSGNLVAPHPGEEIPIIVPADATRGMITGNDGYEKPALAYLALKEYMGDEAFKSSLHAFIDRWHGKRPLPWDMFNTFSDTSDLELNWFFQNWFFEANYLDIAIAGVEAVDDGYAVQVDNIGGAAVPFDVKVVYADDSQESFRQNPGIWKDNQGSATVTIETAKELRSVTLDGGIFVDATPGDNTWASQPPVAPVPPPTEELATLRANPWQWVSFTGPTEQFDVETPLSYLAQFNKDATVNIVADCNNAVGDYQGEGGKLEIEMRPMTAAACPPGSRSDQFVRLLSNGTLYFFEDGNLHVDLLADGGTMVFSPAPPDVFGDDGEGM